MDFAPLGLGGVDIGLLGVVGVDRWVLGVGANVCSGVGGANVCSGRMCVRASASVSAWWMWWRMVWATWMTELFSEPEDVWMILTVYPSARAMTNSSPPSAATSTPRRMWVACAGLSLLVASSSHVEGMTRFPVLVGNRA